MSDISDPALVDPTPEAPTPTFTPPHAEALWKLVTVPHPVIGKAHHLGEALVHAGLISAPVLADALQIQQLERQTGKDPHLGQILVSHGHVTPEQLQRVIDSWLGEYVVDPGKLAPDPAALELVPRTVAERESVLPLLARDDALVLLMADPHDRVLLDELRFLTQRR